MAAENAGHRAGRRKSAPSGRSSAPNLKSSKSSSNAEHCPHVPDAWIDESATKIGYEISFTRYFYKPHVRRLPGGHDHRPVALGHHGRRLEAEAPIGPAQSADCRRLLPAWTDRAVGAGKEKIVDWCVAAGQPEPEFEEQAGGVVVRFRPSGYHPPLRISHDLTDRQRRILLMLSDGRERRFQEIYRRWTTRPGIVRYDRLQSAPPVGVSEQFRAWW